MLCDAVALDPLTLATESVAFVNSINMDASLIVRHLFLILPTLELPGYPFTDQLAGNDDHTVGL